MYVLIQVTSTQCDNILLFWACCWHSDNLYGPWFVINMEYEFDNTVIEGTACIEWRHVSGVRTHRSVKWSLNPLNHQFWLCGSRITAGIPGIVSSFVTLLKKSNYKEDKQKLQKKHKQQLFFNMQHCCQNYSIRTCCNPLLKFHLSEFNKNTLLVLQWNTP